MATSTLQKSVKNKLRVASSAAVEDTARRRFRTNFGHKRWLSKTNRYGVKLLTRLGMDKKSGTVRHAALREYLAASGPAHVIDGWSNLARSADALLRGDASAAIHLAYYAELRAAVALLGLDGIGVFGRTHAVVESSGGVTLFDAAGTHSFVWPALDWWSRPKSVQKLLLGLLRSGGITVWDWLVGFKAGTNATPVGRQWLATWGLDLRQLSQDHFSRNEVSYRPSRFRSVSPAPTLEVVDFVASLWRLLEPSSNGNFDNLDRFLMRIAIERAFQGVTGATSATQPQQFDAAVGAMLQHLGIDQANANALTRFLRREDHGVDPRPIRAAMETTFSGDGALAMQVMSRAALLLRLATASAQQFLRSAQITQADLAFWWQVFGVERGFWISQGQPGQVSDSWADILAIVTDAEDWCDSAGATSALLDLRSQRPSTTLSLGSFELVSMWGLAS